MRSARRLLVSACLAILPLGVLAGATEACSSDDGAGDPDKDPIAWVSPTADAKIAVDDAVQLTVKVNDPSVKAVRFVVDGKLLAACDTTAGPDECRRDALFRTTTTFHDAGRHALAATATIGGHEQTATLAIDVRAASAPGEDGGVDASKDAGDGGTTKPPPPADRGFLDPDKPLHNVFGGVSWAVMGQKVDVVSPPDGSAAAVATCMKTYGASIIKWADTYKVSRGSVVATAITESNCTNPAGSSDGLSSGPMQVTGSTCASLVTGYTSQACKDKMHADPDFSFMIGAKYMGSTYQLNQSDHDPPKIGAAYNAGSIRSSTANRWHMVVTGNHIERFVGAYNAYREWEAMTGAAKMSIMAEAAGRPDAIFEGEHVADAASLPTVAREGQVYFVGDWARRDGTFVQLRGGRWQTN